MRLLPRRVAVRSTGFAIAARLDELATSPGSDASWQQQRTQFWQAYTICLELASLHGVIDPKLEEFRWLLEEVRVSLWAQQLKTA